jgi:hypothetical protein
MKITMDDVSPDEQIRWLRDMERNIEEKGRIATASEMIWEIMEYEKLHADDEEPLRDPSEEEDESDDNDELVMNQNLYE